MKKPSITTRSIAIEVIGLDEVQFGTPFKNRRFSVPANGLVIDCVTLEQIPEPDDMIAESNVMKAHPFYADVIRDRKCTWVEVRNFQDGNSPYVGTVNDPDEKQPSKTGYFKVQLIED